MVEHGFNPEVDLATQVAAEFMTSITWEPVDDQHIVWACESIATAMLESGDITEDLYKERFHWRYATIVVYDDPAFYVHESRRLSAHHFARPRYASVGENIQKMRALWEHFGCPKIDPASSAQRAAFLGCLPLIVNMPSIPHQGILCVGDIQHKYQDWLPHVTHEETEDLDAILKVCKDYEEELTFYSEAEAN